MRFRALFVALALVAVPLLAATVPVRPAAAEDVALDVSLFYDRLAPYGEWVHLDPYGWVWVPQAGDCLECAWRPYSAGYWALVEPYGWTWVSTEEWGWATYHYGRWLYTDSYGWVWVPGTVWAPAWVSFRYGDGWVGWAPLPPTPRWRVDAGIDSVSGVESSIGSYAWDFVPVRWFGEADLATRYAPAVHSPWLLARTQPTTRLVTEGDVVVNRSVDVAAVERARGRAIVRYRPSETADPARATVRAGAQGDTIPVFRARIAATDVKKAPTPRVTKALKDPKEIDAWVESRRAALKKHLDAQRAAADRDLDDGAVGTPPPPPPPGGMVPTPPPAVNPPGKPSADDLQKRRDAAKKAIEDEQKRLEKLLEQQRRNLERRDAGGDAPKGMDDTPKGMDDAPKGNDKDKDKDKDKKDKKD